MELIKNYLISVNASEKLADLSDVNSLIKNHAEKLFFCNIPVLLGNDVSLELPDICEKMLQKREGGYCFEHNKLIYEALLFSGFDVKPLFGRVLNNQIKDVPKTHRFTLLNYENEQYIIDMGFGFMSPTCAIKVGQTPTKTSTNRSYLVEKKDKNTYEMKLVLKDTLFTMYSFDFHEYNEMDFEAGNFYSSKHQNANFVNNLVLSIISENVILSLRNKTYQKIFGCNTIQTTVKTLEEFTDILKNEFRYPIKDEDIKILYQRFISV